MFQNEQPVVSNCDTGMSDFRSGQQLKRARVLQDDSLDRLNRNSTKKLHVDLSNTEPSSAMIKNLNHFNQLEQLSRLNNEITSLRTQSGKLDFEIYKKQCILKDLLAQVYEVNDQSLQLDQYQENLLNEIQYKYDLSIEQYNTTHNSQICFLKQKLTEEIESIINSTVLQYNQQKKSLQQAETKLTNQLKSLEQDLNRKMIKLKEDHNKKLLSSIKSLEDEISAMNDQIDDVAKQIVTKSQILNEANCELVQVELENDKLSTNLNLAKEKNSSKDKEIEQLQDTLASKKQYIAETQQLLVSRKQQIDELNASTSRINQELISLESNRRLLHNQLQELKGNIRVFCRIRPVSKDESMVAIDMPECSLNEEGAQQLTLSSRGKSHSFYFDKIFLTQLTNEIIFEEICQLIQSSLDGYNVCVFAYGQTGSGKTYTMSHSQNGIIPLSIAKIYNDIEELKIKGWNYNITGQFIEIYNETIIDLLLPRDTAKHEIKHDKSTNETSITNVTSIVITSQNQANLILEKAVKNRSTASTKSNERSSRSHSIFILKINGVNSKTGEVSNGTLNLVDLAGSERLSTSQAKGERLKETQAINKSLSSLGDVIYSLGVAQNSPSSTPARHVPYRNSKLTYLLKNSLSGNSKTLMFVNMSPLEKDFNESVNSLRFASKVNSTKLKKSHSL